MNRLPNSISYGSAGWYEQQFPGFPDFFYPLFQSAHYGEELPQEELDAIKARNEKYICMCRSMWPAPPVTEENQGNQMQNQDIQLHPTEQQESEESSFRVSEVEPDIILIEHENCNCHDLEGNSPDALEDLSRSR